MNQLQDKEGIETVALNFDRLVITESVPCLLPMKAVALEEFNRTGLPTRKDEEWRYTHLKEIGDRTWQHESGLSVELDLAKDAISDSCPVRIVFVNGDFREDMSAGIDQISGVSASRISSWESIPTAHFNKVASLENRLGSTNDERFFHLNTATLRDGIFLSIAENAVIEGTIQLLYIQTGRDQYVAPRILVEAKQNSQVKILETYLGVSGNSFTNSVTEFYVARNAIVEHTRVQKESLDSYHVGLLSVHQEADSTYTSTNVQFGAKIGRCDINIWLNGEHTETWLNGTYVGKGTQTLDNHTRIDHAMPNCHSFEVYKGILDEESVGVFNGKIFVYEDAQKTDAKQTNQALLLSPTATINTKPQLEIFADDVKCTHGATVGQLRKDAMFYLQARGISKQEARNILVYAFSAEVLEKISDDNIRELLEAELYTKLN